VPLSPLIRAMLDPAFYPDGPAEVRLVQTHISYVFLVGKVVYKVKKPVCFSFLDFSTLDRRRHFCHEEVRLNRRLAPDTYLGVVAICRDAERFRLGGEDDPAAVEYAVQMRHLPDDRAFDRLLDRGEVTPEMIGQLAETLVEFHRRARADEEVTANGDPDIVGKIISDNFAGMQPFRNVTVPASDDDAIQSFTRDFLARHADLFRRRQAERRIRECHGDLHAEHICFADPLVIFDCIEFNSEYRYCDVASEIAFLTMDLAYHEHEELAASLVARYSDLANDPDLFRLVPFYACYRAYVRGKVDSLKSAENDVDPTERKAARVSASRHFALAYRYTWAYRPCVVAIAGLSGSGKSTVAEALARRTGFTRISSDHVRKELAGLPLTTRSGGPYGNGIYTAQFSNRTYETMFDHARSTVTAGGGAILDATFQLAIGRTTARNIAVAHRIPFLLVECRCSDEEVRKRLKRRAREGTDASDADWDVYRGQQRRFEPFDEHADADRLILDTNAHPDVLVARVEQALRERAQRHFRLPIPATRSGGDQDRL
jgi:uncharacterized protein